MGIEKDRIDNWNSNNPVGTKVTHYYQKKYKIRTFTKSLAYLEYTRAYIELEDFSEPILLNKIEVIKWQT